MKIGYMCGFDDLGCGESEARIRWTYLLERHGHQVIALNRKGYTFDTHIHGDNLNLDLILTAQVIEQGDVVYPDVFTCFFYWAPSSFFTDRIQLTYYNMYMGKYDAVVGGYESKNPIAALSQSPYFSRYKTLLLATASVPKDFALPVEYNKNLKVFYVGMSLRYKNLLKTLDNKSMIDIYGPQKVFNTEPWKDFKSYRGLIPFDGKTIIHKMHDAGIVLALHSKSHNREDFVSNRIFEAAAAGAIIIADDNKFIRRYFGDSVYYLDIFKEPEEQERELAKILDTIFSNKKEAFEKAKRAQKIFLEKLSLDQQVEAFLKFIENEKQTVLHSSFSQTVDCIIYIDNEDDFYSVQNELKKQYYQHLRLVICAADESMLDKIKEDIVFEYCFLKIKNTSFPPDIVNALKSEFFIVLDKNSVMHKNHILKAVQLLNQQQSDFVYSGSYEKKFNASGVDTYYLITVLPYKMKKLLDEILSMKQEGIEVYNFLTCYPSACFVFNRKLISSNVELCNIPFYAVPAVLAIKSMICDISKHDFMYTLSAGTKKKVCIPKTFLYDNHTQAKDEILDKIRSTYSYMIDKQFNILGRRNIEILYPDVQKYLLKMLYHYINARAIFSIKNRKKYKARAEQIRHLIQLL